MVPLNSSGKESGQMATGDVAVGAPGAGSSAALQTPTSKRVINDFSIQVATVNGSGSQSANSVLLKSIFGMGVPVSGKNLFPSNIAGLPTWYTIRASKQGYVARKREIELLVAMNAETAKEEADCLDALAKLTDQWTKSLAATATAGAAAPQEAQRRALTTVCESFSEM